jgi:tetratricopeptide (TPR) repeat protein
MMCQDLPCRSLIILEKSRMSNLTWYEQAVALLNENRFSDAFPLFKQCIGINGISQPDVLFNCGWCLENIGNSREQALAYYLSSYNSAQIDEHKFHAGFRYSWLLIEEKEYAKAQAFLSKILAETQLCLTESLILRHAIYWFAFCLELDNRFLDAIDYYHKVEAFNGEGLALEAQFRKIVCLNQIGHLEAALQSIEVFLNSPTLLGHDGLRQAELTRLVVEEKSQIERALAEA